MRQIPAPWPPQRRRPEVSAGAALALLREGNSRFVADAWAGAGHLGADRRRALVAGQTPFAIVLGCSDSRVPAEIVFDQGLGDLFVIRVAGNIAAPSQIGSIEIAADWLGARLVVVLGHSHCGAVAGALAWLHQPLAEEGPHLRAILDRLQPVLTPLLPAEGEPESPDLMRRAVRANVSAVAAHLRQASPTLSRLIVGDGLVVTGAEYDIEGGRVDFFDGAPG